VSDDRQLKEYFQKEKQKRLRKTWLGLLAIDRERSARHPPDPETWNYFPPGQALRHSHLRFYLRTQKVFPELPEAIYWTLRRHDLMKANPFGRCKKCRPKPMPADRLKKMKGLFDDDW